MPGPIVIDRLTGTIGYADVPASFLLHAIRAGERFGVDPREIILELGERRSAVVGQEDMIIDVAAALAGADGWHRRRAGRSSLDDDPTGAQAQADVPVLLDWRAGAARRRASAGEPPARCTC